MTEAARPIAVVDTSFWSISVRIGFLQQLLDTFQLVVPAAVRDEILHEDPRRPRTRADYQDVFLEVEPEMGRAPDPEPLPVAGLDAGEASVIACARHLGAVALINERRGRRVAASLGVVTLDVPQAIILAAADRRLDVARARRLLARVRQLNSTALEQLTEAEQVLDALQRPD
ncbi:MAG: hypothetical protein ACYDAC_11985 [Candidatus Dormibacteria bacterium]